MTLFDYVSRDDRGQSIQGQVSAESEAEAARTLRGEGKFIVKIKPAGAAAKSRSTGSDPAEPAARATLFGEKFRPDDVIYFTNQLAVMVDTGVSLAEALESGIHDGNSPAFNRAMRGVLDQVEGGLEFSAALALYPRVFPPIYVNLVKASEASGTMGPMLRRLADYMEQQRDLARTIKGALTYPAVMITFAIGVTIFLMTFVLPKFTAIYAGREDALPTITKFLMAFSTFLLDYGLYALGVLIVLAIAGFFYLRRPEGRMAFEVVRFKMPIIGPLYHKTYLTRSLRTLGTMIQSGVSMLEGIQLTAASCGSRSYQELWETIGQRLESGQQLTEALEDRAEMPTVVNKMLSAGERSGQLGPVMDRVAKFSEGELNVAIKKLTAMLEPAIVMFLGIVVGGLVLALLLPIFTISKAMH